MNVSQQMFLLAAQELSFSRAAEKAFVSPQCLSEHIKRLEGQYQATLFRRRPQLQLTAEGQIVLRYLKRIQALEDSMMNELADTRSGVHGTIRLGIPSARGGITIPRIISRFQAEFPYVDIQARFNDTRTLEELLLSGKIDILLGVNAQQHALFRRSFVCREGLYLVLSIDTMRKHFGPDYPEILSEFQTRAADLSLVQDIPFVLGAAHSTTVLLLHQHLLKNGLAIKTPLSSSDFGVQADLCRTGNYATVCSRFLLHHLMSVEQQHGQPIFNVFPVRNLAEKLEVELVTHRDSPPSEYLNAFSRIVRDVTLEEHTAVNRWLLSRGIRT